MRPARSRTTFAKGRRIMSALLPLMRVLEQGGKFVQSVKHGCELRRPARRPRAQALQGQLNKMTQKRELEQVLRTLKTAIADDQKPEPRQQRG